MREAREPLVVVIFKVTAQEQKLIERHATKAGMTVPDYVRPRCISTWSWRATRRPSAWWGGEATESAGRETALHALDPRSRGLGTHNTNHPQ